MLWFLPFNTPVQMSNGRFARRKIKIQLLAKTLVETALNDKNGPNSWDFVCYFVPFTGTWEERSEKSRSEAMSVPHDWLHPSAGCQTSWGRQAPTVTWRSSVIYRPHRREALCSLVWVVLGRAHACETFSCAFGPPPCQHCSIYLG